MNPTQSLPHPWIGSFATSLNGEGLFITKRSVRTLFLTVFRDES